LASLEQAAAEQDSKGIFDRIREKWG